MDEIGNKRIKIMAINVLARIKILVIESKNNKFLLV